MRATALLVIAFLCLAQSAAAIIYQCRDARGTLILTDDEENLPPDCRNRRQRPELEDLQPVSPAPAPAKPAPAEPGPRQEAPRPPSESDEEKSPQAPPARRGGEP